MKPAITPQRIAGGLAVSLSLILLAMSGISGWQRGGDPVEQGLWAAAAICITASVHLFPALVRGRSWLYVLWGAGMVVVLASHAQFMVLAERHAGQSRLVSVQKVTSPAQESPPVSSNGRTYDSVSAELSRARATLAKQAWLPEDKKRDLRDQVTSLERELDRITSRENESRQQKAVTTADPLGQRLESAFGLKAEAVTLVLSLLVALVMEGLAVVMWRLALVQPEGAVRQGEAVTETVEAVAEVAPVVEAPKPAREEPPAPKAPRSRKRQLPSPAEVARLIRQGELDGKVVSIRAHFRCSQQAARELRTKALETLEDDQQPRLAIS